MLDIGMNVPLAGYKLWRYRGIRVYEGYDCALPRQCLGWMAKDFPGDIEHGVGAYLAGQDKGDIDAADVFLGRMHLRWQICVETRGVEFKEKAPDLVVLSNVLHFLTEPALRLVLEKVGQCCSAKTKIYMHVQDKAEMMEKNGLSKDRLLDLCGAAATQWGLTAYAPFEVKGMNGGLHHVWSNL